MTDLQALLARVEEASGPDRALAREIQCKVGGWYRRTPSEGRTRHPTFIHPDDCRDGRPVYDSLHGTDIHRDVPDVTASLDAALALVERVLPEQRDDLMLKAVMDVGVGRFTSYALALLAALLKALLAKGETHE